jgi:hypothetical protein
MQQHISTLKLCCCLALAAPVLLATSIKSGIAEETGVVLGHDKKNDAEEARPG